MGYTCLTDFVHPRELRRSAGTDFPSFTQSVLMQCIRTRFSLNSLSYLKFFWQIWQQIASICNVWCAINILMHCNTLWYLPSKPQPKFTKNSWSAKKWWYEMFLFGNPMRKIAPMCNVQSIYTTNAFGDICRKLFCRVLVLPYVVNLHLRTRNTFA